MALNKQIQFVHQDKPLDGELIAKVAAFDENGNPVDVTAGGSAQTTIPTGALVPGAGINLARGEDGVITASIKDKGITAGMLADGVIPAVPKAAYVPDPAGDTPTKAEYVALRDALVTAGLMVPKA